MEQQQQQQQQQQHQPIQKRETIHNAQYTSHTNNRGRKTDASKEGKKERRKEIEVEGKGSLQLTSNQLRWTGATIKVSDNNTHNADTDADIPLVYPSLSRTHTSTKVEQSQQTTKRTDSSVQSSVNHPRGWQIASEAFDSDPGDSVQSNQLTINRVWSFNFGLIFSWARAMTYYGEILGWFD